MLRIFSVIAGICLSFSLAAQQPALTKPRIMVVPYTKSGEDFRTILDKDVNLRIAITKVKEGFDNNGYTTVDFVGKLKAANDNRLFVSDNQTDMKARFIEESGCDVYVVVEADVESNKTETGVSVILTAYEVSTANSLASKVGTSGRFITNDQAKLTEKAVDKVMDDFMTTINTRYAQISQEGNSVLVDISFADGATMTMASTAGPDKLPLSDVLEDWFSKHCVDNQYHIQGTSSLKMVFDDVKIPLRDANGNNYNPNKYALEIFKFLTSLGLSPAKEIKSRTIFITINK